MPGVEGEVRWWSSLRLHAVPKGFLLRDQLSRRAGIREHAMNLKVAPSKKDHDVDALCRRDNKLVKCLSSNMHRHLIAPVSDLGCTNRQAQQQIDLRRTTEDLRAATEHPGMLGMSTPLAAARFVAGVKPVVRAEQCFNHTTPMSGSIGASRFIGLSLKQSTTTSHLHP